MLHKTEDRHAGIAHYYSRDIDNISTRIRSYKKECITKVLSLFYSRELKFRRKLFSQLDQRKLI